MGGGDGEWGGRERGGGRGGGGVRGERGLEAGSADGLVGKDGEGDKERLSQGTAPPDSREGGRDDRQGLVLRSILSPYRHRGAI